MNNRILTILIDGSLLLCLEFRANDNLLPYYKVNLKIFFASSSRSSLALDTRLMLSILEDKHVEKWKNHARRNITYILYVCSTIVIYT